MDEEMKAKLKKEKDQIKSLYKDLTPREIEIAKSLKNVKRDEDRM